MRICRGIAPPVLTLLIIALSLFAFLSERASSQQITPYDPSIRWSAPQQSTNVLLSGSNVVLSAYWKSEAPLDTAWLATNESGVWENKTSIYSLKFGDSTMGWSNFTWFNASISDTQVCWRIYANNSLGVLNTTPALCFVIKKARLYAWITLQSLNAMTHGNSLMIPQNSTLNLSVMITCMPHASRGSCGNVNATARYNSTSAYPDTRISTTQNDRPFYIIDGTNPKSCPNNPLSAGDSCYISWQVNATGDMNSTWAFDVIVFSEANESERNSTETIFVGITGKSEVEINLTVLGDDGRANKKARVDFFDKKGNRYSRDVSIRNLKVGRNYTLRFDQFAGKANVVALIHNLRIKRGMHLELQVVSNYSGMLPDGLKLTTPIFAFNDTTVEYSHATVYLPKNGMKVDRILHCRNWDFRTASCSSWEVNSTTDYNIGENTTHIWFDVTHFYAYVGGTAAGYNSQLEIWDDTDTQSKYTGEQIYFYANYTNATSNESIVGTGVTCNISFNVSGGWTQWQEMNYNSTTLLYQYNSSFDQAGIFSWNVSCDGSALGYDPLNASDDFVVSSTGRLVVSLILPKSDIYVAQNTTFTINASVNCTEGSCGNVNATARYNSTSAYPDTRISTTQNDRPFYIIDGTNPKSCPNNPLSAGDSCYISWQVNATGDIGSSYKVGVLFESDLPGVDSNHTENKTVTIVSCVVSLILGWTSIDFGTLLPGTTGNPAPDNNNYLYNITVDPSTTCNVDIYIKGSDLNKTGSNYYIGVGNVSWNTENSYSTSKRTGSTDSLVSSAVSPGTNITTFYWIDVPSGIAADTYSGYLWITGVESV